jgi:hypothetical protein
MFHHPFVGVAAEAAPYWLALVTPSDKFPSHITRQMHFSGHTYHPSSANFSSKWDPMPDLRSIGSIQSITSAKKQ